MYKNIIRAAFLFATGIFMTACSSGDDNIADNTTPVTPGTQKNIVTLTGTINIGSSDISRAVDKNGEVSWTPGDQVYVAYEQVGTTTSYTVGTITDVTDNTAKFTAKLENPADNGRIGLAYPYSKVSGYTTPDEDFNFTFTFGTDFFNDQKGTPESITSKKLDYASSIDDGEMIVPASGGRASIKSNITLVNQVSLCKFSLKVGTSDPKSPLSATKLEIMLGGSSTPTYTITPAHSTDVFYVVMQPHTGAVSLKATYNSASTTSATELVPSSVTDSDIGKIIAVNPDEGNKAYLVSISNLSSTSTLIKNYGASTKLNKGKFYKQDVEYTTDQYLPIAVIASGTGVEHYWNNFLALALEDVTSAGVSTASTSADLAQTWVANNKIKIGETTYSTMYNANYDEVIPNVNKVESEADTDPTYISNYKSSVSSSATLHQGWRIPSVTDWRYVIWKLGNGRDATSPKGIGDHNFYYPDNTAETGAKYSANTVRGNINAACGDNGLLKGQFYWTSSYYMYRSDPTEDYVKKAWRYSFEGQYFIWTSNQDNSLLRAVFAI